MLRQVNAAFKDQPVQDRDAGVAEVVRMYARLIDNAGPAGKYRKALVWLATIDTSEKGAEHVDVIEWALAQHSVMSDLGPKLLAALEALQMSPRARNTVAKAVSDGLKPISELDQLAARRAGRGGAAAVDAPAT